MEGRARDLLSGVEGAPWWTGQTPLLHLTRSVHSWRGDLLCRDVLSFDGWTALQVLLAAAYLDDARTGSHMEFDPTISSVRMYGTYKSWWFTGLLYLALVIILSLAIFEQPTIQRFQNFALNKFWATVGHYHYNSIL